MVWTPISAEPTVLLSKGGNKSYSVIYYYTEENKNKSVQVTSKTSYFTSQRIPLDLVLFTVIIEHVIKRFCILFTFCSMHNAMSKSVCSFGL